MEILDPQTGERLTLAEFQAIAQTERRQRNNLPLELTTDVRPAEQVDLRPTVGGAGRGHSDSDGAGRGQLFFQVKRGQTRPRIANPVGSVG